MAGPFEHSPTPDRGLGSRLLARRARGAAAREVEALLAGAVNISDVTERDVAAAAERHGTDLSRLRSSCRDLYRRYLEHCLVDQALSEEEAADLSHLRLLLALDEVAASEVQEEVSCAIYGSAIDEVLADHRLEADEEAFLKRLRDDLGLGDEVARRAFEEGRRRARQRYLSTVVSSDDILVASQEVKLELQGSSETSLEDAVEASLAETRTVLPGLKEIEVTRVRAEVGESGVSRWHVTVRAVLDGKTKARD
jgi:flavin-binding protein dodecin